MLRRPLTGPGSDLLPTCRALAGGTGQKPETSGQALSKWNAKRSPGKRDLEPETCPMRQDKEPHGALKNVNVNKAADKAIIKEKAGTMPDKAVIVEESCRLDKKLAAVTMQDERWLQCQSRSQDGSRTART